MKKQKRHVEVPEGFDLESIPSRDGVFSGKKEWPIQTLSQMDIEDVAESMDIDPTTLSSDELEQIAKRYIDEIGWCLGDDWDLILADAIKLVKGDQKLKTEP